LGDHNYPAPRQSAESEHADDAIIETIEANPGLVLVTLGPLTNVALAVSRKPEIAAKVSRCVVMGGAPCCEGNVTPAAEYNIWVDPEAASIVMRSGLPIELIGWHLCRGEAVLNGDDIAHVEGFGTKLAHFAMECNSHARVALKVQTGEDGICLPDPVAMCLALDPTVGTDWSAHYIEVETQSELTCGMTVVDRLNVADDERNRAVWEPAITKSRAKVCWTIDNQRWKKDLYRALR
jgi:purine nucleosidase